MFNVDVFGVNFEFTEDDINNLMVTALEGGIDYWCDCATIKTTPNTLVSDELYASHILSKSGVLTLHDCEGDDEWDLTLEMLLNGIKMYCEAHRIVDAEELMLINDADSVDEIIQYALFKEIIYC